jgi:hypothetical protein
MRYVPRLRQTPAISLRHARGHGIGEISRYEGGIYFACHGSTSFNSNIAKNRANSLRN